VHSNLSGHGWPGGSWLNTQQMDGLSWLLGLEAPARCHGPGQEEEA
jgi:hypothetical protein